MATASKHMDCISDSLYIGGVTALQNDFRALTSANITHVLNLATCGDYHDTGIPERLEKAGISYMCMNAHDDPSYYLAPSFQEMSDFLSQGRKPGKCALVHCVAGISRSGAAAIAHLMLHERKTLDAAFRTVHAYHPQVSPNSGFWRQLRDMEAAMLDEGQKLNSHRPAHVSEEKSAVATRKLSELNKAASSIPMFCHCRHKIKIICASQQLANSTKFAAQELKIPGCRIESASAISLQNDCIGVDGETATAPWEVTVTCAVGIGRDQGAIRARLSRLPGVMSVQSQ